MKNIISLALSLKPSLMCNFTQFSSVILVELYCNLNNILTSSHKKIYTYLLKVNDNYDLIVYLLVVDMILDPKEIEECVTFIFLTLISFLKCRKNVK